MGSSRASISRQVFVSDPGTAIPARGAGDIYRLGGVRRDDWTGRTGVASFFDCSAHVVEGVGWAPFHPGVYVALLVAYGMGWTFASDSPATVIGGKESIRRLCPWVFQDILPFFFLFASLNQ